MCYIQTDVNVQRVFPSSPPLSEVPVVHLQVAEARLQTGHPRRRVLRLRVPRAGDGRDGKQQLGQRLRRPAFDLRGNVAFTPNNRVFAFRRCSSDVTHLFEEGMSCEGGGRWSGGEKDKGLSHPNMAAAVRPRSGRVLTGDRRSETTLTSFLGLAEDKARQRRGSGERMCGCKDAPRRRRRALHWSGERRRLRDPRRSRNRLQSETVSARVPPGGWWWCPADTAPSR